MLFPTDQDDLSSSAEVEKWKDGGLGEKTIQNCEEGRDVINSIGNQNYLSSYRINRVSCLSKYPLT